MSEHAKDGTLKRIDFHIHLAVYQSYTQAMEDWINKFNPTGEEDYYQRLSDPGAFLEYLDQIGIDYACILAELCPLNTGICTNEQVRDFCRGRDRLIPFCDLNPFLYANLREELRRKVEDEGFRGVKLLPSYQHYYLNEQRMYPLYGEAERLDVPILIHTGSSIFPQTLIKYANPVHLDDVARDFPNLKLIMAHSGRGLWYGEAFFLSKLHANLYMEIAGLPPAKLFTYFPEFAKNTDKIIFGSDWPGCPSIKRNIDTIMKLDITQDQINQILGGNAAKILKL